jgi:hypothetical protein
VFFVCNLVYNMVEHITNVIKEYQAKLSQLPFLPKTSFQRDSLGCRGDANKIFLMFLFCDNRIGFQFLKDAVLILCKVECNCCGHDMTCYAEPTVPDGFRWRCLRMVRGTRCSGARSIRHGCWFHNCHLTLQEVLYLTDVILRRETALHIQHEHNFAEHTVADWGVFCREAMLFFFRGLL